MATKGDPMVYTTQHWLNVTFGQYVESGRFKTIIEDGITGMGTINGLIRGLQILLGIQETADNFGAGTQKLFRDIKRDDNACEDIYGIVQGALWCKGYDCGHYAVNTDNGEMLDCVFDEKVENAVKELESDAGRTNPKGIVDLSVMKALLSMDYFVCNTYYGGNAKIRDIQQYLNRNYEEYIGLRPCDGIYSRRTNLAIIYAIQAEEQIPVGTANGNFGTSTKKCLPLLPYSGGQKSYTGKTYSNDQIKKFIILLNMGLYVNGFGSGDISDVYDKELVKKFQKEYALSVDGLSGKGTWMSLFLSSGDTSRSAKACDCATILDEAKAKTIYNAGYRYVGRYLSGTAAGGVPKGLSREELDLAFKQGLNIVPIFQGAGNYVDYFTEEQAEEDANLAIEKSVDLQISNGTIIYFAVDCDPVDTQITNKIIPYFNKVHQIIQCNSNYKVGVYGTRNVCARVCKEGYAESSFVCDMSTGFSGNLGFPLPDNWAFDQFATTSIGTGNGKIEIDKDAYSGRNSGISSTTNYFSHFFADLEKVYNLALEYTKDDIMKSNKLTVDYFRHLAGNYGTNNIFDFIAKIDDLPTNIANLAWDNVAGELDLNFCHLVENKYNNLEFTFYDTSNKITYDVNHFAATIAVLLYQNSPDCNYNLICLYAGWAGDMISFILDIDSAEDTVGTNNLEDWAKKNICSVNSQEFNLADYLADLDAIYIYHKIKNGNKSLIAAMLEYFGDAISEPQCKKRTNHFINSVGSNYLEEICEVLENDELLVFDFFLNKFNFFTKNHLNASISAFKYFVYKENGSGR